MLLSLPPRYDFFWGGGAGRNYYISLQRPAQISRPRTSRPPGTDEDRCRPAKGPHVSVSCVREVCVNLTRTFESHTDVLWRTHLQEVVGPGSDSAAINLRTYVRRGPADGMSHGTSGGGGEIHHVTSTGVTNGPKDVSVRRGDALAGRDPTARCSRAILARPDWNVIKLSNADGQ